MEPNFYELLGMTSEAEEGTLKLAFRQFAKRNHPDKVTGREEVFIAVKDAFQALKDPVVRFAYERSV
jgi:DnaJ-class molecular chaperone